VAIDQLVGVLLPVSFLITGLHPCHVGSPGVPARRPTRSMSTARSAKAEWWELDNRM
jgi:hypothetical protein